MPRVPAENRSLIGTEGIAIGILRRPRLARLSTTTTTTTAARTTTEMTTLLVNNICFLAYERSYDRELYTERKGTKRARNRGWRQENAKDRREGGRATRCKQTTIYKASEALHHHRGFPSREGEREKGKTHPTRRQRQKVCGAARRFIAPPHRGSRCVWISSLVGKYSDG